MGTEMDLTKGKETEKRMNAAQGVSKSPFPEVLHTTFSTFHEQKVLPGPPLEVMLGNSSS